LRDYTLKTKTNKILTKDQNEIVEKLLENDFFFNCAQTGFGKTYSTLTAAIHKILERKEDDIHFALLLPGSAVKAFTDTFKKDFGIAYNIFTATKTQTQPNARFHIFNYSTVGKDFTREGLKNNYYFQTLKKLKLKHKNLWLIADEAHALQNENTIQYQMVYHMRPWFIGMWFLTATPILNDLDGFFRMVTLIQPNFSHGNIHAFRNKYMISEKDYIWVTKGGSRKKITTSRVVGYQNLDILQQRFSEISIIKSKHYDVEYIFRSALLTPANLAFYKRAAEGIFSGTRLKSGKLRKKQNHNAARLHDLQRVVSNSHPQFEVLTDKRQLTEKELLLISTVKEVFDKNEATLIYFSYIETLERVKYILNVLKDKLGIKAIFEISGSVSTEVRKKVEKAITPKSVVLITSAGTESVNLQKANNLIFYEIPFALRQFIQACGRITRMDSLYDKFYVYTLEAEGTIDTYKKNRIVANSVPIKNIVGGSNLLPTELLPVSLEDIELMKDELLWMKT